MLTIASAEFFAISACNYGNYCINLRKTNLNIGAHEHSSLHINTFAPLWLHYIIDINAFVLSYSANEVDLMWNKIPYKK